MFDMLVPYASPKDCESLGDIYFSTALSDP